MTSSADLTRVATVRCECGREAFILRWGRPWCGDHYRLEHGRRGEAERLTVGQPGGQGAKP